MKTAARVMKLTRSQMIALCGLGVAVCALAGDRLLGGGPAVAGAAAANATPAAVPSAVRPATPELSAATPSGVPKTVTLAARLRALKVSANAADAPRDAYAWPAAARPDASRDAAVTRAAAFRAGHTLKAVVGSGARGRAMVDGRLLSVGQSIDGFELVGVDTLRATFMAGGTLVDLTLPGIADGR